MTSPGNIAHSWDSSFLQSWVECSVNALSKWSWDSNLGGRALKLKSANTMLSSPDTFGSPVRNTSRKEM